MRFENSFNSNDFQRDVYDFKVMDVKSITLVMLQAPFEHCLIIIRDSFNNIRLSTTFKSRKQSYTIHEEERYNDNCAVFGKLENGTWQLEIIRFYQITGNYKIDIIFNKDTNSEINLGFNPMKFDRFKIINHDTRWFRGDLHLHSYYTDGRVSLEEIHQAIQHQNLDFAAISDHSISINKFPLTKSLIIPSTEITLDNLGHYNIHGLNDFIDYSKYYIKHKGNKHTMLIEILDKALSQNQIVCINHPFTYFWNLKHNININSNFVLEVINSPHLSKPEVDNEKAIRFFDFLWNKGIATMAVGGSDAHKKNYNNTYPIAIPETNLYMAGLSLHNVINAIKNGHCFISVKTEIQLKFYRSKSPNDIVLPGQRVSGEITMSANSSDKLKWEIIANQELIYSEIGHSISYDATVVKNKYYRLQARSIINDEIVLFVNPIHNINISQKNHKLLSLLTEFENLNSGIC